MIKMNKYLINILNLMLKPLIIINYNRLIDENKINILLKFNFLINKN